MTTAPFGILILASEPTALIREPSMTDHVVDAVKNISGAVGHIKGLAPGMEAFKKFTGDHPAALPIAGTLAGAAALGGGMHLYNRHQQNQQSGQHHQAFQHAMSLFPELHDEDPEKMHLLWSSAVQVAPKMSTNPLLLGTWMKGLAKGYSGIHLSTEDLKRLQDLEHGVSGKPENRGGMMSNIGQAVQTGAGLANIAGLMSKMRLGQGR